MHSSAGGRYQITDIPMTTIPAKFITGDDLFEQATNVLPLMEDPRFTSKTCSHCNTIGTRHKHRFGKI